MTRSSFVRGRLVRPLIVMCAFVATALLAASPRPASAAPDWKGGIPIVKTTSGAVSGIVVRGPNARRAMQAYLGIPYAASPAGWRRWKPPVAPAPWNGVRAANAFGNHCPQVAGPFGKPSLTEDCLNINVFEPVGTKCGAKLPVMVWIHGGALVSGESDDYDPDRLVERNVIVVTLNYRLGYLGSLATTGLDKEPHTLANYGLLDQQFALRWVRANIAAFGGDTRRTTVFGESAGGASTFTQILSPGSAGLFNSAIIESGAYDILALPSLSAAETAGNAVASAAKCAPSDAACLRALPVSELLALQTAAGANLSLNPAVDGVFLPYPPAVAFTKGLYNHVPIFQGSNHDEYRLFTALLFDLVGGPLTASEYPLAVGATLTNAGLGGATAAVLAQYPLANYASPDIAFATLATDVAFSTPAYITDELLAAGTPLYAYEFADEHAPELYLPPVSFPYAAAHASELQYIFDFQSTGTPPVYTPAQESLKAAMVGYWTHFATFGVPRTDGAPPVPLFSPAVDDMVDLVPPTPKLFTSFAVEHKTAFWIGVLNAAQHAQSAAGVTPGVTLESIRAALRTVRPNSPI